MPGVPSGRACEACRRQKKKCDLSQPSCSRCTRLQIPCIGCGLRRYKFMQQKTAILPKPREPSDSHAVSFVGCTTPHTSRSPSNETTMLAGALVSALDVKDLRYDLTTYGGFVLDLPKRLGKNKALDAAAKALTVSHPALYTGKQRPEMLATYLDALKELRISLDNPNKSQITDTLCAIYLIIICQHWLGSRDDPYVHHGEALAHILRSISTSHWTTHFEIELVTTLCAAMVAEGLINPKIQFGPWFGDLLRTLGFPPSENLTNSPFPSMSLENFASIPEFLRHPQLHLTRIRSLYELMLIDFAALRPILDQLAQQVSFGSGDAILISDNPRVGPITVSRVLARTQAQYSIFNSMAIMLNSILQSADPENLLLLQESADILDEIMGLADSMSQHRPLGTSHVPLCLMAAWVAIDDKTKQAELERKLADYESDFGSVLSLECFFDIKHQFDMSRVEISLSRTVVEADSSIFVEL